MASTPRTEARIVLSVDGRAVRTLPVELKGEVDGQVVVLPIETVLERVQGYRRALEAPGKTVTVTSFVHTVS